MAWPSWFDQSSRPSAWTDWSAAFRKTLPREWPKGLFGIDGNAWSDILAMSESFAFARDMLEQVLRLLWPAKDIDDGVFVSAWERVFGLSAGSSSMAERADRLIAAMRERGTATTDQVKSILAHAWNSDDPADVSFSIASSDDLGSAFSPVGAYDEDTNGGQWEFCGTNIHVYHTDEDTDPDQRFLEYLIDRIKPAWSHWSGGRYKQLKWGVAGAEGAWDQATWG